MAGPVARVLCPSFGTGPTPAGVLELLKSLGGTVDDAKSYEVDLLITETRSVGGEYHGEGRPFLVQLQQADLDAAERLRVTVEFGLDPVWEFVMAAMSKGGQDHQILAELALHLATTYGGIIDFCGALVPSQWRTNPNRSTRTWELIEPDFNRWIKSFPGKVIGCPYETARGTLWTYHIGDTAFLSGWLRSPEFHMIK